MIDFAGFVFFFLFVLFVYGFVALTDKLIFWLFGFSYLDWLMDWLFEGKM